jgi:hypothetical protein
VEAGEVRGLQEGVAGEFGEYRGDVVDMGVDQEGFKGVYVGGGGFVEDWGVAEDAVEGFVRVYVEEAVLRE